MFGVSEKSFLNILLFSSYFCVIVIGHGRLLEPPSRASMWRFPEFSKYNPPQNYNDNELYCGGYHRQFKVNRGRCGPCGDPFDEKPPRENESGGKYGRGVVARNYKTGQVIDAVIQLTTSHRGYFEFRVCDHNNPNLPETQQCFNENVLKLGDRAGTKFPIDVARKRIEFFNITLQLPPRLTCRACILQWHYRTGNSWGNCVNGSMGVGCGDQEVFRACADVSIN